MIARTAPTVGDRVGMIDAVCDLVSRRWAAHGVDAVRDHDAAKIGEPRVVFYDNRDNLLLSAVAGFTGVTVYLPHGWVDVPYQSAAHPADVVSAMISTMMKGTINV